MIGDFPSGPRGPVVKTLQETWALVGELPRNSHMLRGVDKKKIFFLIRKDDWRILKKEKKKPKEGRG